MPTATTTACILFKVAFDLTPQALPPGPIEVDAGALRLEVFGLPALLRGKQLEVFPETGEVITLHFSRRFSKGNVPLDVAQAATVAAAQRSELTSLAALAPA